VGFLFHCAIYYDKIKRRKIMKKNIRGSVSIILALILLTAAWLGTGISVSADDIEPPLETELTMTADNSIVGGGDKVNFTIEFNMLAEIISGYSKTQIVVFLPTGLNYESAVLHVGGFPVVLTFLPAVTPMGTSIVIALDNTIMSAGKAKLLIIANVSETWDKYVITASTGLYWQLLGGDMPFTPHEEAAFTLHRFEIVMPEIPPVDPQPITPVIYNVQFYLDGGVRIGGGELHQSIAKGGSAVAPNVRRDGYTFDGWNMSFKNVQQDLYITALWKSNASFSVQFYLDGGYRVGGGALSQVIPAGGSAVAPYVRRDGYIFLGWNMSFKNVQHDLYVTALWEPENQTPDTGPITVNPNFTLIGGYFVDDKNVFTHFSHIPMIYYAEQRISLFRSVEMDGHILKEGEHYIATTGMKNGTTAIHLKASYLNALKSETHTLRVHFRNDEYANAQLTVEEYVNNFRDVNRDDWFFKGVEAMNSSKLLLGITDTQFDPYSSMTRGQVVTLLYRFTGEPNIAGFGNPFPDVAAKQYYTEAVIWAAANGIVVGHDTGLFAPYDEMTREQFAAVLYRYQNILGSGTNDILMDREYGDFDKISLYAKTAVNKLTMQGVFSDLPYIPGNLFEPRASVNRAEVATVMRLWIESMDW